MKILQLLTIAARHQVYLEGHKTQLSNEFLPFLKLIATRIDKLLTIDNLTDFKRDRLETLIKSVRNDITDIYQKYYGVWREQIIDLAEYEAGFEIRSLKQIIKTHDFKLPSRTQLNSAVFMKPLSSLEGADKGKLLPAFYRDWSNKTISRVEGIIRSGYYTGKTTPEIVREIKGTSRLKFRDGQLTRGNKDITMLTRTAVQHASNEARNETWKANSDVVDKIIIVATLDSRTTPICRALDGNVYPIDSGPRPPFHIGCRTTTAAKLNDKFADLESGNTRFYRDPSGKAKFDLSANTTYYEWLKMQPASYQDSVIGPKRGALLRNGGLSAKRFAEIQLNNNFQPITLKEMRELEPLAFEKAGI